MQAKKFFKQFHEMLGFTPDAIVKFNAVLKQPFAEKKADVLGFNVLMDWDDSCFEFYLSLPSLKPTQPKPVPYLLGLEPFDNYKIGFEKAIDIFFKGNWGDKFNQLVLCKPLIYPELKEPFWYFMTNLNVQVMIGANTGEAKVVKGAKELIHA